MRNEFETRDWLGDDELDPWPEPEGYQPRELMAGVCLQGGEACLHLLDGDIRDLSPDLRADLAAKGAELAEQLQALATEP